MYFGLFVQASLKIQCIGISPLFNSFVWFWTRQRNMRGKKTKVKIRWSNSHYIVLCQIYMVIELVLEKLNARIRSCTNIYVLLQNNKTPIHLYNFSLATEHWFLFLSGLLEYTIPLLSVNKKSRLLISDIDSKYFLNIFLILPISSVKIYCSYCPLGAASLMDSHIESISEKKESANIGKNLICQIPPKTRTFM